MTWMYTDCKVNQVAKPRNLNQIRKMKNTEIPLFPANFVAFPAFIALLCHILEEADWDSKDTMLPWVALSDSDEAKDLRKKDDSYNMYASLLESLIEYIKVSLPDRDIKIDMLLKRYRGLYKKNNYNDNPTTTKIIEQMDILRSMQPNVQWFCREKYCGARLNQIVQEKDDEFLTSLLVWLLMISGAITPDQYNGRLQFMSLGNFDAWKPMFKIHHVSNQTLCKLTTFGHKLVDCHEDEKETMTYYNVDDSYATSFTCFFYDKWNNMLPLNGWISRLRHWGYERQAAREFFDEKGFLSNIYYDAQIGSEDMERFALFIKYVVLPEFDTQWPVE